nr:MAG TPA: hypothetical protein [Microviridae sp.]
MNVFLHRKDTIISQNQQNNFRVFSTKNSIYC